MPGSELHVPAARLNLLVTCEHGGCRVPGRYGEVFKGRERLLQSHRGWDRGALDLARCLARRLGATLVYSTVTRLLVDLNRTAPRNLFSPFAAGLDEAERRTVLARHYHPYRQRVEEAVRDLAAGESRVLHLSVHSFTPVLRGRRRQTHLGLLYDPARRAEAALCADWAASLQRRFPRWRVHRNRPYRGTSDGLTTWLLTRFAPARYLGIELEMNQALLGRGADRIPQLGSGLVETLCEVTGQCAPRKNSS